MAGQNGTRRDLGDDDQVWWTFDDETEGLGTPSAGGRRARGWKVIVALLVAVAMLLPLLLAVLRPILD